MLKLRVEGMTCDGCVRSVERALSSVDPKANIRVTLRDGEVVVESEMSRSQAVLAIREAGFEVSDH